MAVKNQRTFESKYGTFTVGTHRIVSCETKRCDVVEGWNGTVCLAVSGGAAIAPGHAFFYPGASLSNREWMEETLGQGVARWAQAKLAGLHIATGDLIGLYRSHLNEWKGMVRSSLSQDLFLRMAKGLVLDWLVPEGVEPSWEYVPGRAGRRDFVIARDVFGQVVGDAGDSSDAWHRVLMAGVESRLYNWEEL